MAPSRPTPANPSTTWRRARKALLASAVAVLFVAKILNYAAPDAIRFVALKRDAAGVVAGAQEWVRDASILHRCVGATKREVLGGYVCTTGNDVSLYGKIFSRYPIHGGAKASIYPTITGASPATAEGLLQSRLVIPRYKPYQLPVGADQWDIDPYHEVYWRFYYYSLRPTVSLVRAYMETGDGRYLRKLLSMDESFLDASATSKWAWSDEHAVAFRGMILTYQWWMLRERHVLTEQLSARLLAEISRTADFLVDPNHYQPQMNHGTNEIASLLMMAKSFPDLPRSKKWISTSLTRLSESLQQLIDADGVLIENSPYYHFYELDKFWQIFKYTTALHIPVSPLFELTLKRMIRYATYVLQPDGSMPLLGASLDTTIHNNGTYRDMGDVDAHFRYVLTKGAEGVRPPQTSIFFQHAGQTFFRSGWGVGKAFTGASFMSFNVGAYRTPHSQLDSLGVSLYAGGTALLPPPGLFTYAPGAMRRYFQGTASHNAVVVDGESQAQGEANPGPLMHAAGLTYQSAETPVYDGVNDRRTVVMVDKNNYLVIDRLDSDKTHRYEQMWHFFPGARVATSGLSVSAQGNSRDASVNISQLDDRGMKLTSVIGQKSPPAGLCSLRYQIAVPCRQIGYQQRGTSAAYTTLISIGKPAERIAATYDKVADTVVLRKGARTTRISLGMTAGKTMSVETKRARVAAVANAKIEGAENAANWSSLPATALAPMTASDDGGRRVLRLTARAAVSATNDAVRADLSHRNLQVRIKVSNVVALPSFSLDVTSDHWKSYSRLSLRNMYTYRYAGEWLTLSIGKDSHLASTFGHWVSVRGAMNWGAVNGVRINLSPKRATSTGAAPSLFLDWIRSSPEPASGVVAFVFDDGYESILPAAEYLHSHGYPGNIAVIGRYTQLPARGYLNLFQLKRLQNDYGWNMVNHSQRHVDAIPSYYIRRNLGAYERDVVDGATWLQRAGLNSAPNWFIYPHGTTNATLRAKVARFHTFARTTDQGPETYPFGSRLLVKTFELQTPTDEGDATARTGGLTPVASAVAAVRDAKTYRTPLLITFHRIKATPTDRPGYPLAMFKKIVDAVQETGMPVKTLSQLDTFNGVTGTDQVVVTPPKPSLITLSATTTAPPPEQAPLWGWLSHTFSWGGGAAAPATSSPDCASCLLSPKTPWDIP